MVTGGAPGQSHQGTPCVHIPVGSTQAGEGRDEIDPAGIRNLGGVILRVSGLRDEAQLVPDPLDDGAAYEYGALQSVLDLSAQADGDGRQQPVPASAQLVTGVHQKKTAGAVGVFRLTGGEAGLTEEGGLLVAGDARDGYLHPLEIDSAVHFTGVSDLG